MGIAKMIRVVREQALGMADHRNLATHTCGPRKGKGTGHMRFSSMTKEDIKTTEGKGFVRPFRCYSGATGGSYCVVCMM